jgi:hypothetical protein
MAISFLSLSLFGTYPPALLPQDIQVSWNRRWRFCGRISITQEMMHGRLDYIVRRASGKRMQKGIYPLGFVTCWAHGYLVAILYDYVESAALRRLLV